MPEPPPLGRPAGPAWAVPAPPAPPAPPAAPPADERSFPGWAVPPSSPASSPRPTRLLLLLGAALLLVAAGVLAVRSRRVATDDGPVGPEVIGACVAYATDGQPRHVDRLVPCAEPHDGRVLAFAGAAAECPAGTDAVLATARDAAGAGADPSAPRRPGDRGDGLLCVEER
jgi:hypothetical protein